MTSEKTFSLRCVETQGCQQALLFPQCHYHCYNKQSLWPQAKCGISKLESPNQYFHYLHYKLPINGSSLGNAPSFTPCTSECCSRLTAGIPGSMALWRVVFLRNGQESCWFRASESERGRKQGSSQSSFCLSFRPTGKIRNRSWEPTHLPCELWAGMKLAGTFLFEKQYTRSTFFILLQTKTYLTQWPLKKHNLELKIHKVVTAARLKYQKICNSDGFREPSLRSLRSLLIPPESQIATVGRFKFQMTF